MAHDVFISHSTKDKLVADAVCAGLEAAHIRCWMAPRDIPPGAEWPAAIVDALKSARVMVLIFSESAGVSEQVRREITVAADAGAVIVPLKIDDTPLEGLLEFYLSGTHWLDAMNPPTEAQVAVLVETVSSVVKSSGGGAPGFGHRPTGRAPSRRATWMITVATALAFVAVGVAVWSAVRPDAVVGPGQKHGELEPAGTFPLSIDPTGADVEGELLYLACGENGLLILDVSDPAAPREVGGYREAAVSAVDVEGGVAFISVDSDAGTVSSDDGAVYLVRVLDVSDPTAPTPITDYRTESFGWDAIQNITVHGDYLALSTWQKIELVDVSDPRRPAYLWSWEGVSNTGITCHTAFIDAEEFESPRGDVLVLAAGWEGLRLFDLSDPTAPTPLGVYTAGDWVADVDTIGTTVHAAVGGAGLVSLNVAEPASPQPLATYDVPGATADLHPFGELLYYSFYDTSDDLSLGNGFGSVRVPGAGEELVAVTGAEVVYPVGPVTTLIGDDAHLYVAVEGLGLFVYEPDRN